MIPRSPWWWSQADRTPLRRKAEFETGAEPGQDRGRGHAMEFIDVSSIDLSDFPNMYWVLAHKSCGLRSSSGTGPISSGSI